MTADYRLTLPALVMMFVTSSLFCLLANLGPVLLVYVESPKQSHCLVHQVYVSAAIYMCYAIVLLKIFRVKINAKSIMIPLIAFAPSSLYPVVYSLANLLTHETAQVSLSLMIALEVLKLLLSIASTLLFSALTSVATNRPIDVMFSRTCLALLLPNLIVYIVVRSYVVPAY